MQRAGPVTDLRMRPYGPLRGRGDALARALSVVRRAQRHSASGVVLLSGEAGIGKTALLSEIYRHAAHSSLLVARSKCDEIEQAAPGAPMIGLLRSGRTPLLTTTEFEGVARVAGEPLLLVDRIADHLDRLAADHRLLLAVDDVQWADRVSRYALRTLISRAAGRPVVWALASRSAAAGLSVGAADVVEVDHIQLGPLGQREIAEIARDRLGSRFDHRISELLAAAGGNPFVATQIIDSVALSADTSEQIPAPFRTAVARRLAGLSATARHLIDAIAAAGSPVPILESATLCGVAAGPTHDADVDAVLASGLVVSTGTDLRFSHDLAMEAVYDLIAPDLRRRLHTRFAQHLLATTGDPALAAAHARAAITIGDDANAAIMLSGAEAMVNSSAVDAAGLALQAFQTLRPHHAHWLESGERALAVLSHTQHCADAIAVADLLLATVDDPDVISRIETQAAEALWLSGHFTELAQRADRGISQAAARRDLVARFQALGALARTRIVPADQATEQADIALAEARSTGDHDALALALQAAGEAAHNERRHQLALKHFRELRSVTRVAYLAEEIMELQLLDRYHDAQMLLDAATDDSRAGAESLIPTVLFAQAKQYYNVGELRAADQTAAGVVELGEVIGNTVHVVEAAQIRAFVALLRGEPALAGQRLRPPFDVRNGADTVEHPGVTFTRGWLTAARGHPDDACRIFAELLAAPERSRSYWAWWPCWMTIFFETGMACGASKFTEQAVEVAEEGARRNPDVATLTGLALNLRGLLDHDLAMVAESANILQHSPRRVLRAAGTEAHGMMLLEIGERDAGLARLDAAWDEYNSMGASARRAGVQRTMRAAGARRSKWTRSHVDTSSAVVLSDAERRVAHLVAVGHTNKATAKSLGLSVNTVGTHLRSIYAKLGVRSRVQLSNTLRRLGELQ